MNMASEAAHQANKKIPNVTKNQVIEMNIK